MGEIGDMFRAMMRAGEAAELERATEAAPLVRGGFVRPGRRDASPEYSGDASRLAAGERDFAAPCHHAWLRRLAEPLHRQRQLFVLLFRAQRDPLRQRLTA